ncbi:MAG: OmpA family protein [Rhodocyclales bacterium]|nr:OmpA family protein [Rhodocyclales bacterium]
MKRSAFLPAILASLSLTALASTEGHPDPAAAILDSVYFAPDSAALDARTVAAIASRFGPLRDHPGVVTLRGYTDELGSSSYEVALGQKRIDAVRSVLQAAGFPAGKIRTEIVADDEAAAASCGEDCDRQARRVDIGVLQ